MTYSESEIAAMGAITFKGHAIPNSAIDDTAEGVRHGIMR